MLPLLMATIVTFVSPDGRIFDVRNERDALAAFAVEHHLIDSLRHLTNLDELLDASSGKKQLQLWVPLHKLKWIKQVNKKSLQDVERAPEPILGGKLEHFVQHVAPRIPGMQKVTNASYLSRLFSPTPLPHVGGWSAAKLSLDEARAELQRRQGPSVVSDEDRTLPTAPNPHSNCPTCV